MDKHLMFEHMLREHVNVQRIRMESALEAAGMGEYSRTVSISYEGEDGGKWTVSKYFPKGSVTSHAAELEAAVDGWLMMYAQQNRTKVLRSMIAGPSAAVAED